MSEPSSSSSRPSIRCFLSYAHDDNENLSFVDEFRASLSHFTYANSGRRLEIFVDHDAIGWGEDWRERIRESIDTALVFIPLVTLQYLDRPMCREEIKLFADSAKKLGVSELFLPVVVLGHGAITEESADPVAQMIAKRQFKDLKNAVIEGPGSAVWRSTLLDLSEALIRVVDIAEAHLQAASESLISTDSTTPVPATPRTAPVALADEADVDPLDDDGEELGLLELMERLGCRVPITTRVALS